jgi:GNAT superfamily N-acetyltransferase
MTDKLMAFPTVLHLEKRLHVMPQLFLEKGLATRFFAGEDDASAWLALRASAIQSLEPLPGSWEMADFCREFTAKKWWNDERMLLAYANGNAKNEPLIASVTLAGALETSGAAAIHWLLVHPDYRRQGIGRQLVAAAESLAWQLGARKITVETHARWHAAVALYRSLGYRERVAVDRPPLQEPNVP